jgi:superfamily II RNA helicase
MTTEVFRNMLYAAGAEAELRRLAFVVLDECHYINDVGRGTVWEESIINSPRWVQLAALSATIANADQLAAWMTKAHGATDLVYSEERPVPLRFHYFERGQLTNLLKRRAGLNRRPLIPASQRRFTRPWELQVEPDEVVTSLRDADMLPAIYFVFSRRGCEQGLAHCAHLELVSAEEYETLEAAVGAALDENPSLRQYPYLRELLHGVAVHHAGLLPAWKVLIERLFQRGLVKVVFATETLAAGINMPARTTVIASLRKRGDTGYRSLTANEFLQMSGRAGRRGMDRLGHVVVVADPFRAAADAAELAASPPDPLTSRFAPTYGMVLNLLRWHTPQQAEALLRRSFGQFLADQAGRGAGGRAPGAGGQRKDREGSRRRRGRAEAAAANHESATRSLYWNRFLALKGVLEEYGYVDREKPTAAGLLAAALRVENEVLVAEVLRSTAWEQQWPAELAGTLTALTTEDLRPDAEIHARPGRRVHAGLEQLRGIARHLRAVQRRHRVDVPARTVETACGLVELWAGGADWETITAAAAMDEGDIVHLMRRLLDLLRQIPQAPGIPAALADLASAAARAIDREPVNEVL